ncbi:hypothetical protein [Aeromonas veronii]
MSALPQGFEKKVPILLKLKTKSAAMPFVASARVDPEARFWNVPMTGGVLGGVETGEALALLYLKNLRQPDGKRGAGNLQLVARSMFASHRKLVEQGVDEFDERMMTINGQITGFLSKLDQWLSASAKFQGSGLDNITNAELLKRANAGLRFDAEAYYQNPLGDDEYV